ncbi:MAG: (d)CMP kinase [Deltaproteobacteria bacterium]|nr:(d)CMP kinase [Deltaproteobacteria bacterium]
MDENEQKRPARSRPVVAIDGPAGSGKSTAARLLAKRLGFILVDTGALYRAIALVARERGIPWTDGRRLGRLAKEIGLVFLPGSEGKPRLLIDGKDRSDDIRTPEISLGASDVSKHPELRAALLGLQRDLGKDGGVVLEGRDIGTVVFPDAEVKVFLVAEVETRAKRRMLELKQLGHNIEFENILEDLRKRDEQDRNRSAAPLRPAEDAVLLDTTDISIDTVVDQLLKLVKSSV